MSSVIIRGEDRGELRILCYVDGDMEMVKISESGKYRKAFIDSDDINRTLIKLRDDGWKTLRIRAA